jgi:hypothetical protein
MQTMLFDYNGSAIDMQQYAWCMRAAYLLAEETVWGGNAHVFYSLVHYGTQMTVERQIEAIRANNGGVVDKNLEEIAVQIRRINRLRFKPAPELKELKRLEKGIKDHFSTWLQDLAVDRYEKGFFEVSEITTAPELFHTMNLNEDDPELETDYHEPYSKWLQRQAGEFENSIVFLPADFLAHPGVKGKWFASTDPQAMDLKQTYLHECFTLPDLSSLSMLEMKAARKQLATTIQPFRSMTNEWTNMFWDEGLEEDNTTFFNESMLPAIAEASKQVEANTLLKNCFRRTTEKTKSTILMGEVPVQLIWQFYRDNGAIPDNTWQNLQQAIKEDDRLENRWPVMVMQCHESMLSEHSTAPRFSTIEHNPSLN